MENNTSKLGRSISKLMGKKIDAFQSQQIGDQEQEVDIFLLRPNPYQPRKVFKEDEIKNLASSIKENGLMSPIIVRKRDDFYEIIAGERRWRAMRSLNYQKVPVIVREATKDQMITLSIVENLQREDLNPIEKGLAFQSMMKNLDLNHEQIAEKLGKDRSTITNFIRLTSLPEEVQDYVSRETISMGHARSLLGLKESNIQKELAKEIIQNGLSVRQTESRVKEINGNQKQADGKKINQESAQIYVKDLERKMSQFLGTKVSIKKLSNKSKMVIEFYSNEDFERISKLIGFKNSL